VEFAKNSEAWGNSVVHRLAEIPLVGRKMDGRKTTVATDGIGVSSYFRQSGCSQFFQREGAKTQGRKALLPSRLGDIVALRFLRYMAIYLDANNSPRSDVMKHYRLSLLLAACCLPLLLAGCSDEQREQYHLSGEVRFDGRPVPAGMIMFDPDVASGNDGTQGYAEIQDGHYDTSDSGKGITGGTYQVRITGFEAVDGSGRPQRLFNKYEIQVDLPATGGEQHFDVPASAAEGNNATPDYT